MLIINTWRHFIIKYYLFIVFEGNLLVVTTLLSPRMAYSTSFSTSSPSSSSSATRLHDDMTNVPECIVPPEGVEGIFWYDTVSSTMDTVC
jgi:hypothetical protein